MNEITKELLEALKSCERVMSVELDGLTIIQPELKEARAAIKKAETVLAEPQADADGWIPWSGGECPVHGRAPVEIQAKSGRKQTGLAEVWEWRHFGHRGDIIAYRIAKGSAK